MEGVPPVAGVWEIADLQGPFKPKSFYDSVNKHISEIIQIFCYSCVTFEIAHWNKRRTSKLYKTAAL